MEKCIGCELCAGVCPDCDVHSVTFDPVMYLTLPLPEKKTKKVNVTVVFADPDRAPTRYGVEVPKYDDDVTMATLKEKLAVLAGIADPGTLCLCDIFQGSIYQVWSDDTPVSDIQHNDVVVAFQLGTKNMVRRATRKERVSSYSHYGNSSRFGSMRNEDDAPIGEDDPVACFATFTRKPAASTYTVRPSGGSALNSTPVVITLPEGRLSPKDIYWSVHSYLKSVLDTPPGRSPMDVDSEAPPAASGDEDAEKDEGGEKKDDEGEDEDNEKELPVPETPVLERDGKFRFRVLKGNRSHSEKLDPDDDEPIVAMRDVAVQLADDLADAFEDAIPEVAEDEASLRVVKQKVNPDGIPIDSCIEMFLAEEQLSAANSWYCKDCKKHQEASKKIDVYKLPPVLVIMLKRFPSNSRMHKLDTLVDFPIDGLDMGAYALGEHSAPLLYDLTGVSNHYGGLGGGHYTAYVRNVLDNEWYDCDDSSVRKMSADAVKTTAAYILVYVRRDVLQAAREDPAPIGDPLPSIDDALARDPPYVSSSKWYSSSSMRY